VPPRCGPLDAARRASWRGRLRAGAGGGGAAPEPRGRFVRRSARYSRPRPQPTHWAAPQPLGWVVAALRCRTALPPRVAARLRRRAVRSSVGALAAVDGHVLQQRLA